jgi:dTDP-4-dehydrorhamnose reductase
MRILVLGARGMLGTDLLDEWHRGKEIGDRTSGEGSTNRDELFASDMTEADIRDAAQVETLTQNVRPDWVVLCAAYTDVDGCERNRELAFAVNATAVANVARSAEKIGARIYHVSTDYVFDGKGTRPYETSDSVAPINVYGASKAAGEEELRKNHSAWCLCRTAWLFGVHGSSFPEKILKAWETCRELSVVNDQVGSPTYTRDLARAIRELVHREARGIVHITNEGVCTWYDFAREILAQSGIAVPVHPISTDQSARPARRPGYSVMSPSSLHAYGVRMRPWQEALKAFLKERAATRYGAAND